MHDSLETVLGCLRPELVLPLDLLQVVVNLWTCFGQAIKRVLVQIAALERLVYVEKLHVGCGAESTA